MTYTQRPLSQQVTGDQCGRLYFVRADPKHGSKETIIEKGRRVGLCDRRRALRKIRAVEGIKYSSRMKGSAAIAKSELAERRKTIIEAYRKA